jgi:hypothetical protein
MQRTFFSIDAKIIHNSCLRVHYWPKERKREREKEKKEVNISAMS